MHLDDSQSLDEGIYCLYGNLLSLMEHYVNALKQRYEVFALDVAWQWLFEQALNDSIERGDKIFLIDVERRSSTNLQDLEGAEQAGENIRDAMRGIMVRLTFIQFNFEVLSHDRDQIPDNLQVNILSELG